MDPDDNERGGGQPANPVGDLAKLNLNVRKDDVFYMSPLVIKVRQDCQLGTSC